MLPLRVVMCWLFATIYVWLVNGIRTNTFGIDFMLNHFFARDNKRTRHILVQELPYKPESFIHLDMIFTMLDYDKCMVYEPIILQPNRYQTVHITVDKGKVKEIKTLITCWRH